MVAFAPFILPSLKPARWRRDAARGRLPAPSQAILDLIPSQCRRRVRRGRGGGLGLGHQPSPRRPPARGRGRRRRALPCWRGLASLGCCYGLLAIWAQKLAFCSKSNLLAVTYLSRSHTSQVTTHPRISFLSGTSMGIPSRQTPFDSAIPLADWICVLD